MTTLDLEGHGGIHTFDVPDGETTEIALGWMSPPTAEQAARASAIAAWGVEVFLAAKTGESAYLDALIEAKDTIVKDDGPLGEDDYGDKLVERFQLRANKWHDIWEDDANVQARVAAARAKSAECLRRRSREPRRIRRNGASGRRRRSTVARRSSAKSRAGDSGSDGPGDPPSLAFLAREAA